MVTHRDKIPCVHTDKHIHLQQCSNCFLLVRQRDFQRTRVLNSCTTCKGVGADCLVSYRAKSNVSVGREMIHSLVILSFVVIYLFFGIISAMLC